MASVRLAVGLLAVVLTGCWPQPGYGPEGQNHNPFEQGLTRDNVASLGEVWSVDTPYTSQPVVSDGRVFVGGLDRNDSRRIGVEAFATSTGTQIWQRLLLSLPQPAVTFAVPPAFSGDLLWAGNLPSQPYPNFATALVRLDPATGDIAGEWLEQDGYPSPPATAGPVIAQTVWHLGSGPTSTGSLVVRDAETASTLWTATLPSSPSRPVVSHGQIYLTAGLTLYAFDVDGCPSSPCDPTWSVDLAVSDDPQSEAVGQLAATTTGDVVVTSRSADTTPPDGDATLAHLQSYASDGSLRWHETSSGSIAGMAVADDVVHVTGTAGDATHHLRNYAVGCDDPDGCEPLWTATLPSPPTAGPIVGGGVVYAGVDGEVRAYDQSGCSTSPCADLASVPVEGRVRELSVAEGRLFVVSDAAELYDLTAFAPS